MKERKGREEEGWRRREGERREEEKAQRTWMKGEMVALNR